MSTKMGHGKITFYPNENMEMIYYRNCSHSYPTHTHANHIMIGYVMEGIVRVVCNNQERLYNAGEHFCIMPDVPHAMETVNGMNYSMLSICIAVDSTQGELDSKLSASKELKKIILNAPENILYIKDMAQRIGSSPYYMIRQFKASCGLTPHQFQIQCRVRKAQRLLEKGKSVTEVAYATGFCDQSHFDRCFHKIVRLTPSEYKQSLKCLA